MERPWVEAYPEQLRQSGEPVKRAGSNLFTDVEGPLIGAVHEKAFHPTQPKIGRTPNRREFNSFLDTATEALTDLIENKVPTGGRVTLPSPPFGVTTPNPSAEQLDVDRRSASTLDRRGQALTDLYSALEEARTMGGIHADRAAEIIQPHQHLQQGGRPED